MPDPIDTANAVAQIERIEARNRRAQELALPPFNAEARCPKCGNDDIHAAWHEANPWSSYEHKDFPTAQARQEHICRYCRRCAYRWLESPLDMITAYDQAADQP